MVDGGGLAVHESVSADDVAAVHLADGLVAEADAEDGCCCSQLADEIHGNARLVRRAWTGGNADLLGRKGFHLIDRQRIVAENFHLHPQLAEVLD